MTCGSLQPSNNQSSKWGRGGDYSFCSGIGFGLEWEAIHDPKTCFRGMYSCWGTPGTHGLSYEIGLLLLGIVCLKCGKAWEWFLNTPSCCPRKAQTQSDLGNWGWGVVAGINVAKQSTGGWGALS